MDKNKDKNLPEEDITSQLYLEIVDNEWDEWGENDLKALDYQIDQYTDKKSINE